jgi:hypothetical protein
MKGKDMSKKDMPKENDMPKKNDMKDDHMMSDSLRLVGSSGLDKHLGQRVSVKGSVSHEAAGMQGEAPAFNVTSLKVVSKSCS